MRIKLITLILALTITHCLYAAESTISKSDNDEWYPFYFPEKLDPDSPLNIGKLVLDPPAGKHGFVKVKNGHFYFEDGTRAKFWGTNLCFAACFPDKKYAEILAERIAYFGFNAVRLHHMDWGFEPQGIFKDICPAFKDPQMKITGILSEIQLDKLDYLIYQLKQHGIYVDINLLVSRHFTEADGVIDAAKLGMAAKPYSMFDPKLIELQKQYAKNILTHYNPYTKLHYCNDPTVALIEIINESSLTKFNPKDAPAYYIKELTKMQNISNDDIEKKYYNEITAFLRNELGVKIPITGSQYSSPYALSSCDFIDKHSYWDHPKFPNKQWDNNDFIITNKSALLDKNLGIINDVIMASREAKKQNKPFTLTEWNHCYPNQYGYETPILISAEAVQNDWDALFQFAFSHGWAHKPEFDIINGYFDTMGDAQRLLLTGYGAIIYLKDGNVDFNIRDGVLTVNSKQVDASIGFLKGKSIEIDNRTLNPINDGVIVTLKVGSNTYLSSIGVIKNSCSDWNTTNKKYNWGKSPTLMQRVIAEP